MNFIDSLEVHCMVQQKNIHKFSEDSHHCNATGIESRFNEGTDFVCTTDENKIKVREPDCLISAVQTEKGFGG